MEYSLETQNLSKRYGKVRVLDGLDMHVPRGSIYGLIGKNGAGKSTLMRLVCGLQKPSGGSYSIGGVRCESNTPAGRVAQARRHLGAIVETPAIYLNMTAEENLKQQGLVLGVPSNEPYAELLSLVGLKDVGRKKAGQFSLGMRQRLGIAVALVGNPDLLILDEPINGLDPQGIIEIRELVLRLNQRHGITCIISSHILDELAKIATHYGFLNHGRLVQEISAAQLHANTRTCTRVQVSDVCVLTTVLDSMQVPYEVVSETEANLYARVSITELVQALSARGCELLSSTCQDESLESYFINLIGEEAS